MLLKDKHRALLESILSLFPEIAEARAFGSRVNGTTHEGSDLDLLVSANENSRIDLPRLSAAFQESYLPFKVDVFDRSYLPKNMLMNILEENEVVYEKKESIGENQRD